MTALHRELCVVLGRVAAGEIAVISKHRRAIAMIVPVVDESELRTRDPATAAELQGWSDEFGRRARARRLSALRHGRWYGRKYRRYRR